MCLISKCNNDNNSKDGFIVPYMIAYLWDTFYRCALPQFGFISYHFNNAYRYISRKRVRKTLEFSIQIMHRDVMKTKTLTGRTLSIQEKSSGIARKSAASYRSGRRQQVTAERKKRVKCRLISRRSGLFIQKRYRHIQICAFGEQAADPTIKRF